MFYLEQNSVCFKDMRKILFHANYRRECWLLTRNLMKFVAYCKNIKRIYVYIGRLYIVLTDRLAVGIIISDE